MHIITLSHHDFVQLRTSSSKNQPAARMVHQTTTTTHSHPLAQTNTRSADLHARQHLNPPTRQTLTRVCGPQTLLKTVCTVHMGEYHASRPPHTHIVEYSCAVGRKKETNKSRVRERVRNKCACSCEWTARALPAGTRKAGEYLLHTLE